MFAQVEDYEEADLVVELDERRDVEPRSQLVPVGGDEVERLLTGHG